MSNKLPFHLGGRPFKLLLDIFLYSDLSVENFIKGLKVSTGLKVWEHWEGLVGCFSNGWKPLLEHSYTCSK